MQRDYDRLTSNKKSLQESFRDEREKVIIVKVDINQERKKKWQDMAKQKRQLQLVFRQKIEQIRAKDEIIIDRLKKDKHMLAMENE